jgi:hypothetical protein
MTAKSDRELDRIVAREKPGYRRVARPRRPAGPRTRAPDAGTPDLSALHAAVESLGLWDIKPGARGRGARAAAGDTAHSSVPRTSRPDPQRGGPATHHIVTVGHARQHESDPLQTRVIVVSRSQGRIIGEQG